MEELLSKMPTNIPVMGYPWAGKDIGIGEGPGVSLFAEFGKYLVGSIDTTNLTVHSGIRVASLRQARPACTAARPRQGLCHLDRLRRRQSAVPTSGNFPQRWADKVARPIPHRLDRLAFGLHVDPRHRGLRL